MTGSRAPANPYTTAFETTVTAVDGTDVELSETYFYPEGGGQPADRGTLGGVPVVDVQERDGTVIHDLAETPPFEPGELVAGEIDQAFRTYCMRAHTASHVLYGAARRLFDDLGYAGFDIGEEKVRVDLATPSEVEDSDLVELERLTNRAVWDDRAVNWSRHDRDDALAREDVAFNAKTAAGIDEEESVRLVEVEGWDVAACGGTHVSSTVEIGPVTVLERSNPGGGETRVEFAVGPSALDRRAAERRASVEAADALDCGRTDLGRAAEDLRARVDELEGDLAARTESLIEARLAAIDPIERDGTDWLVGAVAAAGPNDVGDHVRPAAGDRADVVTVAGREGQTFVVVASDGGPPAEDVVADVTSEFGGGGGGNDTFAQAGGIDADPDDVVAYLR